MRTKDLLKFFAQRFREDYLQQGRIRDLWEVSGISDGQKIEMLRHWAAIRSYVWGNTDLDNKTIDALIWAVSQYAHEYLEVEPRLDITSQLLFSARNEPGLHVLKQYYRDHFFHALEVCFLGHSILLKEVPTFGRLLDYIAILPCFSGNHKKVLKLWYVAALLHDIGYAIEEFKGMSDAFKFFGCSDELAMFTNSLENLVRELSEKVCDNKSQDYGYEIGEKPGEDHGVASALHLEGLLRRIGKDDPRVTIEEYKPAIRAIMLHNLRTRKVIFEKDPLGFLLVLCDTIEEWNRPRLSFATAPIQILAWLQGYRGGESDLDGPLINVDIEHKGGELNFKLEYDNSINRDAGAFNLWLDSSCNLQRLDFSGLTLDIRVEYITPIYCSRRTWQEKQQYHRLQDAMKDTHMTFLKNWFPRQTVDGHLSNKAIEYYVSQSGVSQQENLVLDLRQLSKLKPITKDIDEFRNCLKEWRYYNEDRDFVGDYAPKPPN
jgi:hypothetical protein